MTTPVTLVTGFLGSGKTTLLKHIVSGDHGRKIAVIQNELAAETGIEAPGADGVVGANGEVFSDWVELANGCVCCSVRDDLVSALEVLVKREGFDNILIETTGLADPGPLASIFWLDDALDSALQLDAIITIVDSRYCMQHLDEVKPPGEVNECARQIAFADRIILNKQDMVSDPDRQLLLERVRCINRHAPVFESEYSRVPLEAIIGVNAFDLDHAAELLAVHQREEEEGAAHHHHHHGHGHAHEHGGDCEVCEMQQSRQQNHDRRHLHSRHGDAVGTVTLSVRGEFDLQEIKVWLGTFLWEEQEQLGMDLYRYKGLVSLRGERAQHVLQGVHDTFEFEAGPTMKARGEPLSKFVFIGKGLDEAYFQSQLEGLAGEAAEPA